MKRLALGRALFVALTLNACADSIDGPRAARSSVAGRAGKSTGPTDPTVTLKIPLADALLALRSDRKLDDGTYSVYADGVCGVQAKIFATTAFSNTGDMTFQTSYPKGKSCGRTLTLAYPDAVTESLATFSNLNQLQNTDPSTVIPVGAAALRRLIVGFEVSGLNNPTPSRCGRVIFGDNGRVGAGTDMLLVTRIDARTWRVQSQTAPNDRALCEKSGAIYSGMTVDLLLIASTPLPT